MVSINAAVSATSALILSSRRLAFDSIAGYEPFSQVTDHNAIDLDQEAMEEQLDLGTVESFANALALYNEGAHSKSVAQVTLAAPLTVNVSQGTSIMGVNATGAEVAGKAYTDNVVGATSITVQYKTSDSQKNYVGCQVGASQSPNTEGCFAANGTLSIDGSDAEYSYDVLSDNINNRHLAGFSTKAERKMYDCDFCPHAMYEKFYDYYGAYDYANQLILAAFSGEMTNFTNFNNDFGLYDTAGKEQVIKKGTAYISLWMYVIREMEDALDDCNEGCTIEACNDDIVHAWDESVAFYTGTLEGIDGSGSGKLAYALADKRCPNFKTCGSEGDETSGGSYVNMQIFEQFTLGQAKLVIGECASARAQKEAIEILMLIPLIQGTLRYAYKTANDAYSEKAEAEGVVFAAAVLPVVASCDAAAAKTIADNMVAGQNGTADFPAIKSAFESTYSCMGVDPAMVGGLYDDDTGTYYEGAEPLAKSSAASMTTMLAVGVAAATSLFLFL